MPMVGRPPVPIEAFRQILGSPPTTIICPPDLKFSVGMALHRRLCQGNKGLATVFPNTLSPSKCHAKPVKRIWISFFGRLFPPPYRLWLAFTNALPMLVQPPQICLSWWIFRVSRPPKTLKGILEIALQIQPYSFLVMGIRYRFLCHAKPSKVLDQNERALIESAYYQHFPRVHSTCVPALCPSKTFHSKLQWGLPTATGLRVAPFTEAGYHNSVAPH